MVWLFWSMCVTALRGIVVGVWVLLDGGCGNGGLLYSRNLFRKQRDLFVALIIENDSRSFFNDYSILPFLDLFNKESRLYQVMTTKPGEVGDAVEKSR